MVLRDIRWIEKEKKHARGEEYMVAWKRSGVVGTNGICFFILCFPPLRLVGEVR